LPSDVFPCQIQFSLSLTMLHVVVLSFSLLSALPNNVRWKVGLHTSIMKLFIVQFSRNSCIFITLRSKYSPCLCSQTPQSLTFCHLVTVPSPLTSPLGFGWEFAV
jgi:hypothetical protein